MIDLTIINNQLNDLINVVGKAVSLGFKTLDEIKENGFLDELDFYDSSFDTVIEFIIEGLV